MSFEIQEDPTKKTSGLTSARQIVDVTDGITFSYNNTTSSNVRIIPLETLKPSKQNLETLRPNVERQKFHEALKKSIAKDINILKELSKY